MGIMNLEFYIIDEDIWYIADDGRNVKFEEGCTEVISKIINIITEYYPDAYNALAEIYKKSSANVAYYRYLIARRFCKCNFGKLETSEIDVKEFCCKFEKVDCPLRGECKHEGIICMPRFNSSLSKKEFQVMRLVYDGCSKEEIAERLFLSPFTIKNHIKSVYAKLGIHEKSEFIQYANKNRLFS